MKLKLLLLALLLPFASFGANTNLFDNVRVNSNLTLMGSQYFTSANGTKTLTSFDAFGNMGLQLGSLEQSTNYLLSPVFIIKGYGASQSFLVTSGAVNNSIGTIYVSSSFVPMWFRGNDLDNTGINTYDILDSTSANRFSIHPTTGRTTLFGLNVTEGITGSGVTNTLNNQVLTGNGSIITRSLGDARYQAIGGGSGTGITYIQTNLTFGTGPASAFTWQPCGIFTTTATNGTVDVHGWVGCAVTPIGLMKIECTNDVNVSSTFGPLNAGGSGAVWHGVLQDTLTGTTRTYQMYISLDAGASQPLTNTWDNLTGPPITNAYKMIIRQFPP